MPSISQTPSDNLESSTDRTLGHRAAHCAAASHLGTVTRKAVKIQNMSPETENWFWDKHTRKIKKTCSA
ncbi:hypothetical protein ABID26_006900 [Mesorhizobium shonense]|uniref:Uncharacterized protein n=1 Tax=Mesorhizobium shonense TaxID=1209948 RepID=A0ABV2I3I2_9HYPH